MTQYEFDDRRNVLEIRYRLTREGLIKQGRSEQAADDEAWLGYDRALRALKAERGAA